MRNINYFRVLSGLSAVVFLLAACAATPLPAARAKEPKGQPNVVAFTGTVEAIEATQWTISGQEFTIAPQAALDPTIAVGDKVNVEATVFTRDVVATKVELSAKRHAVVDALSDAISTLTPADTSSPDLIPVTGASEAEVFGTVETITPNTITVDGVTYDLTNATEIKDTVAAGDTVKLHVTIYADGTVTVREIEKKGSNHDSNNDHGGNSGNSSSGGG